MNKKNEMQNSTERILKSKYLQKEKQKTIPLLTTQNHRKIMLTDLCTEEKAKVGQLIKTLETRKQENESLNSSYQLALLKIRQYEDNLKEIREIIASKQQQCTQLNHQINTLEENNIEHEIIINQLRLQLADHKKIVEYHASIKSANKAVGTDDRGYYDQSTQTKQKKPKYKDRGIQIQIQTSNDDHKNSFYRPHSKSFEKIMKTSHQHRSNQSRISHNSSERNSTVRQEDTQNNEENTDQCFDELAKKWLKLKEKNMTKLKDQYQQSKAHFFRDESEPREFSEEEQDYQQKEAQLDDLDQMELNKLLKAKNFSASILLNQRMADSQTSRKGILKKDSQQKLKKKDMKSSIEGSKHQKPILKKCSAVSPEPSDKQLNFYQSDLLDLVDSINQ